MAQLVRAPPCHGGGRGFESLLGRSCKCRTKCAWGLSSAGRASALQAEGHRFEPCWSHFSKYADMAQLAEQLICNQQVNGSSPLIGFGLYGPSNEYGWIPEWPKGADCKSVGTAFEGSNPSPSIKLITRGGAVWKLVGLITRRS